MFIILESHLIFLLYNFSTNLETLFVTISDKYRNLLTLIYYINVSLSINFYFLE